LTDRGVFDKIELEEKNMELKQAEILANDLMRQFLPSSWHLQWNNCKTIFGRCNLTKKIIFLSKPIVRLNDEATVKDTILHEIAHALVEPGAGHGGRWQRMAIVVGCRPERCYDEEVVKIPEGRYIYECPICHKRTQMHRKFKTLRSCGICNRRFDPNNTLRLVSSNE
jgi:predicted SprT family Zn-dependent metalloprotease